MTTDDSNAGVWLWLVLIVVVNTLWVGMDVWLYRNGHELLTTEFREGLAHPLYGPVLCFLTAGSVAAFFSHMWSNK